MFYLELEFVLNLFGNVGDETSLLHSSVGHSPVDGHEKKSEELTIWVDNFISKIGIFLTFFDILKMSLNPFYPSWDYPPGFLMLPSLVPLQSQTVPDSSLSYSSFYSVTTNSFLNYPPPTPPVMTQRFSEKNFTFLFKFNGENVNFWPKSSFEISKSCSFWPKSSCFTSLNYLLLYFLT